MPTRGEARSLPLTVLRPCLTRRARTPETGRPDTTKCSPPGTVYVHRRHHEVPRSPYAEYTQERSCPAGIYTERLKHKFCLKNGCLPSSQRTLSGQQGQSCYRLEPG